MRLLTDYDVDEGITSHTIEILDDEVKEAGIPMEDFSLWKRGDLSGKLFKLYTVAKTLEQERAKRRAKGVHVDWWGYDRREWGKSPSDGRPGWIHYGYGELTCHCGHIMSLGIGSGGCVRCGVCWESDGRELKVYESEQANA
jgi:hypothetical protein